MSISLTFFSFHPYVTISTALSFSPSFSARRNFFRRKKKGNEAEIGEERIPRLFPSVVSPFLVFYPSPSCLVLIHLRRPFSPLEINYSTFFSRHYAHQLQIIKEPDSDFFSKNDRHLILRPYDPRDESPSLKPAERAERTEGRIQVVIVASRFYKRTNGSLSICLFAR